MKIAGEENMQEHQKSNINLEIRNNFQDRKLLFNQLSERAKMLISKAKMNSVASGDCNIIESFPKRFARG